MGWETGKSTRASILLLVLLPAFFTGTALSSEVIQGGRIVSTPQQLNRNVTSTPASRIPGSQHSHVYQRQEYGKNYRSGHSVNGPYGNITIWSARPVVAYQTPARHRPGHASNKQVVPATGLRLRYVPGYGKPPANKH
jgi:hypothetical protein